MRVLVTGGAGFIGANLCQHLLGQDWVDSIAVIDDLSTGFEANLAGLDVDFFEGSILDVDALGTAMLGADAIVHLAARPSVPRSISEPLLSHAANATGTLNVLDVARGLDDPLVIVASSSSVYGANPTLPKHEGLLAQPMSPYAVSKLAAEQYTLAWQHSYGMRTLPFRFFNVFGPLQAAGHAYAAVIPAFVDAALRDVPLTVHGDGTQSRDFTYVGTVCETIGTAIRDQISHDAPVNLAFNTRTTLLAVIEELESLLGRRLLPEHVESRVGDVPHSQADDSTVRALFPSVEPVDLASGLAATVEWMKTQTTSD